MTTPALVAALVRARSRTGAGIITRSTLDDGYIARSYSAEVEIQRGGSGRTVTAYAAIWDTPTEIQDQHGHYMEVIDRSAFDRTMGSGRAPLVLWNHGLGMDGRPDAIASVPIARSVEVRSDRRGLLTTAEFGTSPLAEHALEAIKAGHVTGYSFRSRVNQSDPQRVPRIQRGGALPTVRRLDLGPVTDYGPTPSPFYADAGVVAVRGGAGAALSYRCPAPLSPRSEVDYLAGQWRAVLERAAYDPDLLGALVDELGGQYEVVDIARAAAGLDEEDDGLEDGPIAWLTEQQIIRARLEEIAADAGDLDDEIDGDEIDARYEEVEDLTARYDELDAFLNAA